MHLFEVKMLELERHIHGQRRNSQKNYSVVDDVPNTKLSPVRQHRRALRGRRRDVGPSHQLLGIQSPQKTGGVGFPVDTVDQAGCVGRHLLR